MNSVGYPRQIRTSGLMSGEGKRSHWPSLNTTAPFRLYNPRNPARVSDPANCAGTVMYWQMMGVE